MVTRIGQTPKTPIITRPSAETCRIATLTPPQDMTFKVRDPSTHEATDMTVTKCKMTVRNPNRQTFDFTGLVGECEIEGFYNAGQKDESAGSIYFV